jgi:serine/threonine protein kinase
MICESKEVVNEICDRVEDELLVVVKSNPQMESFEESRLEKEVGEMINLRHPCISSPIGFVVRIERGHWEELKVVRMYFEGNSLLEILSMKPTWWTSTIQAKVVLGIVLGLRFVRTLGLIHGNLSTKNIVCDSDHLIEIVDIEPNPMVFCERERESESESEREREQEDETRQLRSFSSECWTRAKDIHAFASILLEIVAERRANGEISIPTTVPTFVSNIIETGLSLTSDSNYSFNDIFKILKDNQFAIEDGVDSAEVSAFVG